MGSLFKFISEQYPIIGLIIVVAVITFLAAKYHLSIQQTKKKVDELPCDAHEKTLDKLETKVDNLQSDMVEVKKDMVEVKSDMIEVKKDIVELKWNMVEVKSDLVEVKKDIVVLKTDVSAIKSDISGIRFLFENASFAFAPTPTFKRKSPVSLSDLGEKIAEEYNIAEIVDRNWPTISAAIKALGTTNPYDIQEFSRDTAFTDSIRTKKATFFTESDIDRLRVIAYKSGENIYSISFIAGILIRDRYFEENRIEADDDVDKQDL